MGYMSWTACNTAVDFLARIRFPRAAGEPPPRLRSWGAHLFRFSRRSLRLAFQSAARRNETNKTYVHPNKKNEPLIKHVDQWFIFHFS